MSARPPMTKLPTEDEFLSMIRRHEMAACGVKKDDTRTHETTLAALTQAKRDLLYAFDEQARRIAELEAEIDEHEEHLRSAMLGIGGADEAPCGRCLPLQAEVVRQGERIAALEAALRFYADCEWGWNGAGDYEPMILELPDVVPVTFNCKFAGSVARAALLPKEATDEHAS